MRMDKKAIESFAVSARKKLIGSCKDKAALLGIHPDRIYEPEIISDGILKFTQKSGQYITISGNEIEWRNSLLRRISEVGYNQVMEETAYSWFNRLIAIRFMEVNGFLPLRVLSAESEGKVEPDIVTEAPYVSFGLKETYSFTQDELKFISDCRMQNKTDDLFKMLLIKQSDALQSLLPGFVRKTEDYMKLLLNFSFSNPDGVVRRLVTDISEDDFREAVEIIGWLYQYYITELNQIVYDGTLKKSRISKDLLPAATTIYTTDWAIRYMVENSLGRLWLEGHPRDSALRENWKYYLDEAEQEPSVAAELRKIRERFSKLKPEEITFIDPCMGSGHILVYAFEVLMDIYRMAGYQERDAARLIVEKNLYGLDIDDRAGQLAYFAVMMKARKYNRRILSEGVSTHLFSIPESNIIPNELIALAAGKDRGLAEDFGYLIEKFKDAKEYGSILKVKELDFAKLRGCVDNLLNSRQQTFYSYNDELHRLRRIIDVAEILSKKYDVVCTNPPYLGSNRFSEKLNDYVVKNYTDVKSDLSMVMLKKALSQLSSQNGFVSFITTSSWMFLSSFEKLREFMLENAAIESLVDFGTELFDGKVGHNIIVAWVNRNTKINLNLTAVRLVDYCYSRRYEKEPEFFEDRNRYITKQSNFSKIPSSPIAYWASDKLIKAFEKGTTLNTIAKPKQGLATGENNRFLRFWYEIDTNKKCLNRISGEDDAYYKEKWYPYNKGGDYRRWYGNLEYFINWENDGFAIRNFRTDDGKLRSVVRSPQFYFKECITWSKVTIGAFSMRYIPPGCIFDVAGCSLFCKNEDLKYILGFMNSVVNRSILSCISPTLNYEVGHIASLPIIFPDNSEDIQKIVSENISLSKTDWDSFETSWDFVKHPFLVHKGATLEESFENWKKSAEERFYRLKENEEELNRIFIDIYGLGDELTPEVEEKDVTVRKADLTRDVKSFISYAVGCMLGRYSPDKDGLVFAGGEWNPQNYASFPADEDGIIPITDKEYFSDDITARYISFLKVCFGKEHLEENIDFTANALGNRGDSSRAIIRNYFLNDFYKDHCKIYQKKPIYWLFDSGKENGFKALIYLHRYTPDTLGRVRIDYLHQLQKKYEDEMETEKYMRDNGSVAEKKKANIELVKLEKQLLETRNYDQALGHMASQRISIDLDDGVAVNYAKFQNIVVKQEGLAEKKINLLGDIK